MSIAHHARKTTSPSSAASTTHSGTPFRHSYTRHAACRPLRAPHNLNRRARHEVTQHRPPSSHRLRRITGRADRSQCGLPDPMRVQPPARSARASAQRHRPCRVTEAGNCGRQALNVLPCCALGVTLAEGGLGTGVTTVGTACVVGILVGIAWTVGAARHRTRWRRRCQRVSRRGCGWRDGPCRRRRVSARARVYS